MTKIIKCVCDDKWMDKVYGKGNRVMNSMTKPNHYRCTKCSREVYHDK